MLQSNQIRPPYLSSMDLERIAYQTIKAFDMSLLDQPRELNVDLFAERFLGLKMDFVDLSNNASILGMMVFSNSSVPIYDSEQKAPKVIQVNGGTTLIDKSLIDSPLQNRFRFTIAHECAHWLLHKPKGKAQPIVCRTIGQSDSRDWLEWQADNLASTLLMPAASVHAFMKQYVKENRETMEMMYKSFGERYARDKRDQIIRIVALTFGVSQLTAELRLRNLRYIKPKLINQEVEPPLVQSINKYLQASMGR